MATLARLIGHAHPALVHFPIAALVLAALARARPSLQAAVRPLLGVGLLGALLAALSGTVLASAERIGEVGLHRALGWSTLAAAAAAGAVARRAPGRPALLTALLLASALLAGATGHAGGELVYGAGFFGP